jgi:hypothetical protein
MDPSPLSTFPQVRSEIVGSGWKDGPSALVAADYEQGHGTVDFFEDRKKRNAPKSCRQC